MKSEANDEIRMTKAEGTTNDEARIGALRHSGFVIRSEFGFRHSSFPTDA